MATPTPQPAVPARLVSSAPLDFLCNELVDYLLRNLDDSREGREELYSRLESTGYDIGRRFAERMTRDRERLLETLDVMKWLCREFWPEVFRKSVDKLQMNNMGVFVLQDTAFRWTRYVSGPTDVDPCAPPGAPPPASDTQSASLALTLKYLLIPCGLIRGALASFGLAAVVNVDVSALPRAVFQVRVTGSQQQSDEAGTVPPSSSTTPAAATAAPPLVRIGGADQTGAGAAVAGTAPPG